MHAPGLTGVLERLLGTGKLKAAVVATPWPQLRRHALRQRAQRSWRGSQAATAPVLEHLGACLQGVASTGNLGSTVVGSYGYMPPEQFRGGASPASDLYGLGATLLFLLSGERVGRGLRCCATSIVQWRF